MNTKNYPFQAFAIQKSLQILRHVCDVAMKHSIAEWKTSDLFVVIIIMQEKIMYMYLKQFVFVLFTKFNAECLSLVLIKINFYFSAK